MLASATAVLVRARRRAFHAAAESDRAAWTAALSAHARRGSPVDVLHEFTFLRRAGATPDERSLAVVLSSCARLAHLLPGWQIHAETVKAGFADSAVCQGSLLNMYAKCGCLDDARRLFDGVPHPDAVSWTAMIGGYVQAGRSPDALNLFDEMLERGGIIPDEVALVTAITACVRLGRLAEARRLFAGMASSSSNSVAWNAMISGHAQNGHELEALEFFREMHGSGVKPTRSTIGSVLSATANLAAFDEGMQVQSVALRLGLASNVYVGSSLISFYAKCGAMEEARKVFDSMLERNLVTWNTMLGGYAQNGMVEASMELFMEMRSCSRLTCDEYTYVSLFSAAAASESCNSWRLGWQLHGLAIKTSYDGNTFAGNSLVDMYCKVGDLGCAARQFELLPRRDVVSWNSLMAGQVHGGLKTEALLTFLRMRSDNGGLQPDSVTLSTVISACSRPRVGLQNGEQAHCLAVKLGLESNPCVGVSLVDFYGKLGEMASARRVFALISENSDSEVPINALIAGYVQNGDGDEATKCFRRLLRRGLKPSAFTFAGIFPAIAGLGLQQLHGQALKLGFLHSRDVYVDVSLLAAYLRTRRREDAVDFLSEVPRSERSLVLWTAAISGHSQSGDSEEAISLFWEMIGHGAVPDQSALASAIGACGNLASLWRGQTVHGLLVKIGFSGADEYAGSALVDMYAKCGEIDSAARVFDEIESKQDAASWNAMISGLAKNGRAEDALAVFRRMQEDHPPDAVTYLAVLTACSHGGLVTEGRRIFNSMAERGVNPRVDHYGCLVDLLGRGGHLEEAEAMVAEGMAKDAVAWGTVAAACRVHGDGERGGRAAGEAMKVEPEASAPYLTVLQMCAESGDWEGARKVREAMREKGVRKREAGCSWISAAAGETSAFVAGDRFHPRAGEIFSALQGLGALLREEEDPTECSPEIEMAT